MAAHFLCCLPLRLGVVIISFLQFIFSGVVAAAMWYQLAKHSSNMSTSLKVATIVLGVHETINTLFSGFGFIGALRKKLSFIPAYATLLAWTLGFQLVFSVLYLVAFFISSKSKLISICTNGSTDQNTIDYCTNHVEAFKWAMLVVIVVPLLVWAYGAYVVSSYAKKLRNEDLERSVMMNTTSGFQYNPVNTMGDEAMKPLTGPDMTYPYSDASHSFGNTAYHAGGV